MPKHIALLFLLTLNCLIVSAQQELSSYQESAGQMSMLYRGKLAPQYRFLYNGTFYIDTPEFKTGEILYNGRLYKDIEMNIDASRGVLVVRLGSIAVDTDMGYVSYAILDGRKYIPLGHGDYKDAPEGFYEVLYEGSGSMMLSHVSKLYTVQSGNHNGDDIGYYDPKYKERIGENGPTIDIYFARKCLYYAIVGNKFRKITNKSSIYALLDKNIRKDVKKAAGAWNGPDVGIGAFGCATLKYAEGLQ